MLDNTKHAYADRGDDCYETPPVAINALLDNEPIVGPVWEPACGYGAIVTVLRERGLMTYASDINDYGCPDSYPRIDFLKHTAPSFALNSIITNPPYKLAQEFVAHALLIGIPKIAMLLRLAFLESQRRTAVLDCGLLSKVYVFKNRLPMMHRDGWTGPKAGSNIPFAWFVWEQGYKGDTIVRRI